MKPEIGLLLSIQEAYEMDDDVMDRIPPEKAMEILKKGGLDVNMEQTRMILDFLYQLADITIAQCLKLPH